MTEREGENDDGQDACERNRHHHLDERAEPRQAVDHGGVLEVARNRLVEAHQEPGAERHREARIDEHERPESVLQAERGDDARERDEQDRRRHKIGEKDRDPERLCPGTGHACECVSSGDRQRERDRDDGNADESRIDQPLEVLRILEQHPQMIQRRRVVEQIRVVRGVVEILRGLESRDQHPIEGEGEERHEEDEDRLVAEPGAGAARACGRGLHQVTSVRRARTRKKIATATSTGNMKSEIAAPPARSPPWIPVK